MGKYNFTALRVRQTAYNQLAGGKISKLPRWADVVGDIPPAEVLVRTLPLEHPPVHRRVVTNPNPEIEEPIIREYPIYQRRTRKEKKMFRPKPIEFEEDKLRTNFYKDHPWELARPRILVESTGKDFEKYDWKQMPQPGKGLDGERYVLFFFFFFSKPFPAWIPC